MTHGLGQIKGAKMFIIKDHGVNNHINIPDSVLAKSEGSLNIHASNCSVVIGKETKLRGLSLVLHGEGGGDSNWERLRLGWKSCSEK